MFIVSGYVVIQNLNDSFGSVFVERIVYAFVMRLKQKSALRLINAINEKGWI